MKIKKSEIEKIYKQTIQLMNTAGLSQEAIIVILHNEGVLSSAYNDIQREITLERDDDIMSYYNESETEFKAFEHKHKAVFEQHRQLVENQIKQGIKVDYIPPTLVDAWGKIAEKTKKKHIIADEKINIHEDKVNKILEEEIDVDIKKSNNYSGFTPGEVKNNYYMFS